MARYRKVDSRIWNDAKFRALSDNGKLVFFMLLTHPSMTALGAMRTTLAGLAEELGWSVEAFREGFREASQKGMAKHDEKACLMVLPNFLRYNRPESPNVVRAWGESLDLLPECPLKCELMEQVRGFVEGLSKAFVEALPKAFAKSMANQEQEQEQEQEKNHPPPPPTLSEPGLWPPREAEGGGEEPGAEPEDLPAGKWIPKLHEAWNYYLERCERGSHYEFTRKRQTLGLRGLRACAKYAEKRGASADPRVALGLFKLAIDRLAESAYHNGKNESGKKYRDWEVLFSSTTLPAPQKLTDYWLNDEKFPEQARGAA
jgi:hypothetical protein